MVKSKRILIMADENKEMPVLGEMIVYRIICNG